MKPPLLSHDELRMVKEAILYPLLLDRLDQDLRRIPVSNLRFQALLASGLEQLRERVLQEHLTLKKELKHRGIRIYAEERTAASLEVQYLCRGYHHQMLLLWDVVRTELQRLIGEWGPLPAAPLPSAEAGTPPPLEKAVGAPPSSAERNRKTAFAEKGIPS